MLNLDKILVAEAVEIEDVKNVFKTNGYEQEAVENWLYVNETKTVIEMANLAREVQKKNISFDEFLKLSDVSDNKFENIKVVFRAYREYFNVNVFFKDFFDSYMNPDYGKVSDEIYKEVYGE
jgi:hypothetical protein